MMKQIFCARKKNIYISHEKILYMALQKLSRRAKWLIIVLAIISVVTIVNAAVFVFYDMSISAYGQVAPIIFELGNNANGADLRGTTISVELDSTQTSATITIHPTWRTNFYKDILRITNQDDSNTYYIKFNVITAFSNSKITAAYLYVRSLDGLTTYATIDLLSTTLQPDSWVPIDSSTTYRVDLEIVYTPGPDDDYSERAPEDFATLQLVYSPQNSENP